MYLSSHKSKISFCRACNYDIILFADGVVAGAVPILEKYLLCTIIDMGPMFFVCSLDVSKGVDCNIATHRQFNFKNREQVPTISRQK